ncbi:MAG: hypothetical protein KJ042_04880 [Deltaproteobacteria bacterium]|nr:hypothetical protein [Deltaproteobacteria bacterium]
MTAHEQEKILRALLRAFSTLDLVVILREADEVEYSERFELYRRKLLEAHGVDDIDKIDLTNAPSFEAQLAAYVKWADSRPQNPAEKFTYL